MRCEELTPRYSIAIRTLGTAGEKFRQELESIVRQTIQPERVIVYVADTCGVKFVDGTIGREEYRYVKKGMVAQRALPYEELTSPYLLLLDDDVELAPDTAERLLKSLVAHDADAVGADIFKNQDMSLALKTFAILTNWVAPHCDSQWAYKVTRTGAFSYLSKQKISEIQRQKCEIPEEGLCLPTQKLDGPCVMWKKDSLAALHWEDELWMDRLSEFAYGDDLVETYKCYVNGGKLLLNYDAGVTYLNAKTASSTYHHTHKKYYIRSLMSAMIWYRIKLGVRSEEVGETSSTALLIAFALKCVWLLLVNIIAGILLLDLRIPVYYLQGLVDAWRFSHSDVYRVIPKYKFE